MRRLREYARALTPREIAATYRWPWNGQIDTGNPFWDGFVKGIIRLGPLIMVVDIILWLHVIF